MKKKGKNYYGGKEISRKRKKGSSTPGGKKRFPIGKGGKGNPKMDEFPGSQRKANFNLKKKETTKRREGKERDSMLQKRGDRKKGKKRNRTLVQQLQKRGKGKKRGTWTEKRGCESGGKGGTVEHREEGKEGDEPVKRRWGGGRTKLKRTVGHTEKKGKVREARTEQTHGERREQERRRHNV